MPADQTILVVDDEEVVLNVARDILNHYGYRALLAHNSAAASAQMQANADICLVLLDAGMPPFAINTELPIVVLSGSPPEEALRHFDRNRISGFLRKPYTASRLRDAVALALRPRRLAA